MSVLELGEDINEEVVSASEDEDSNTNTIEMLEKAAKARAEAEAAKKVVVKGRVDLEAPSA